MFQRKQKLCILLAMLSTKEISIYCPHSNDLRAPLDTEIIEIVADAKWSLLAIITSSVVVDRCGRKTVVAVRGCQTRRMVRNSRRPRVSVYWLLHFSGPTRISSFWEGEADCLGRGGTLDTLSIWCPYLNLLSPEPPVANSTVSANTTRPGEWNTLYRLPFTGLRPSSFPRT